MNLICSLLVLVALEFMATRFSAQYGTKVLLVVLRFPTDVSFVVVFLRRSWFMEHLIVRNLRMPRILGGKLMIKLNSIGKSFSKRRESGTGSTRGYHQTLESNCMKERE